MADTFTCSKCQNEQPEPEREPRRSWCRRCERDRRAANRSRNGSEKRNWTAERGCQFTGCATGAVLGIYNSGIENLDRAVQNLGWATVQTQLSADTEVWCLQHQHLRTKR